MGSPFPDYTLKVHSKQDLKVCNSMGVTNMIHMDGSFPSGFTRSAYRKSGYSTTGNEDYCGFVEVKSFADIWDKAKSFDHFWNLFWNNWWTMFVWFHLF